MPTTINFDKLSDLKKSIFFGFLSFLFGFVQFKMEGLENDYLSLNEVPTLISALYISNPLYLLIITVSASLSAPNKSALLNTILLHSVALIPYYYLIRRFLVNKSSDTFSIALKTLGCVSLYYIILLMPFQLLFNWDPAFFTRVVVLARGVFFEYFITCVSILFFHQFYSTNRLLRNNLEHLESIVSARTAELDNMVVKLQATNNELEKINGALDKMVYDRTEELEKKNKQLTGYAFINSHLLRAPLANIIGLSEAIKTELKRVEQPELFEKFQYSCYELDQIVRLLGEFLSEESVHSDHQLNTLQRKIENIAGEIRKMI